MKFIYKCLIVFGIFLLSLVVFSAGIEKTIFGTDEKAVAMKESSLPSVVLEVEGNRINRLKGYAANLDELLVRDCITPLTESRTFNFVIDENGNNVRKLKYEIFNLSGDSMEEGNLTVLDSDDPEKVIEIKVEEPLDRGVEYIAKFTLITNTSKRIYYYTRLKFYEDGRIKEKLDFVSYMHSALLSNSESRIKDAEKYLEPKRGGDRNSLAHVDINSPIDMVTYGKLEPKVVYEDVPTFTEFYAEMASVKLESFLSVEKDEGEEYYRTTEKLRFNYTPARTYLYNYERDMNAVFNPESYGAGDKEMKLGICADENIETAQSENGSYMAFVYENELIEYDISERKLVKVFSFNGMKADAEKSLNGCHRVRLLKLYDNGDADFCVYGYMSRGEYEGRVGIVLYRYHYAENEREERQYIPINSSYSVLFSDMTDFTYVSEAQIFYFSVFNEIYAFDLAASRLTVLATGIKPENLIFCPEEHYVAWQECSDDLAAKQIILMDLETGEQKSITTEGDNIKLYGSIANNIVYGFGKYSDIETEVDGSRKLPSYLLIIGNGRGERLKTYYVEDVYVSGISSTENMLVIERVEKTGGEKVKYKPVAEDTILNRADDKLPPVAVVKHVTDRFLTEFFVTVPGVESDASYKIVEEPKNMVINHETTYRVTEPEQRNCRYYAYSFGGVIYASENAGEVIKQADEAVGTVIDRSGRVVWERGVKSARAEIADVKTYASNESMNSIQASVKMLGEYYGYDAELPSDTSGDFLLPEFLKKTFDGLIDMSGATLNEVLYHVYKKNPVMAIRQSGAACIITGYDVASVIVYEPAKGKSSRYSIGELAADFEAAGNKFYSISR